MKLMQQCDYCDKTVPVIKEGEYNYDAIHIMSEHEKTCGFNPQAKKCLDRLKKESPQCATCLLLGKPCEKHEGKEYENN